MSGSESRHEGVDTLCNALGEMGVPRDALDKLNAGLAAVCETPNITDLVSVQVLMSMMIAYSIGIFGLDRTREMIREEIVRNTLNTSLS